MKKNNQIEEKEIMETIITEDQALELIKEKFLKDGKKLYQSEIEDVKLLWRPLKRSEFKEIDKEFDGDTLDKQEKVVSLCCIYPSNVEELVEEYAGLATVLADEILGYSGFNLKSTVKL